MLTLLIVCMNESEVLLKNKEPLKPLNFVRILLFKFVHKTFELLPEVLVSPHSQWHILVVCYGCLRGSDTVLPGIQ